MTSGSIEETLLVEQCFVLELERKTVLNRLEILPHSDVDVLLLLLLLVLLVLLVLLLLVGEAATEEAMCNLSKTN